MTSINETDQQLRDRLGLPPHVSVVPNEASIRAERYPGKRISPDPPGTPGRERWPRWTEELGAAPEPPRSALERLRAQWESKAIAAGCYAVAYVGPCAGAGCAGRTCPHRSQDGIATEVIIVDPRVPRILALGRVVDEQGLVPCSWQEYRRQRQVHRSMAYRQRAGAALRPAESAAEAGKGVIKLLAEAEQLLARLRILVDRARSSAERKQVMSELIAQVEAKLKTASAKYKGLA